MTTLLLLVGALAAGGPVATAPLPLTPAAMVRRLPLAQRCEIAAALGEEMLHYAIRVGRVDDFFVDRRGLLVVFLDGSTADAAKLIASTERCAPIRKVRVDDDQRAVWTVELAGPERRVPGLALVLHLEPELETSGPRFHFSWKTNEPYGGNDRPAPPELTMETGQPMVGSTAPTLHIYVEPHTPGIDRRTELWLPARSLLMDAPSPEGSRDGVSPARAGP